MLDNTWNNILDWFRDRSERAKLVRSFNEFRQQIKRKPVHNSTYKKLAVQWLNEVQFFNQTFVQVDSFVIRNRQLLIAANRYN